jgi:hypothetical protein
MVGVEFQDIEDSLRILSIIFPGDGRFRQQLAPLFWHALVASRKSTRKKEVKENGETYGESTGDWVKPNMDFMDEVRWVANAHQRTSAIHIVEPPIDFLVVLQRQEIFAVVGFQ